MAPDLGMETKRNVDVVSAVQKKSNSNNGGTTTEFIYARINSLVFSTSDASSAPIKLYLHPFERVNRQVNQNV